MSDDRTPAEIAASKRIKEAATAHTDLNIFAAVQALMERSLLSTESHADEQHIVAICLRAQQKCLKRYDRAVAKLAKGRP